MKSSESEQRGSSVYIRVVWWPGPRRCFEDQATCEFARAVRRHIRALGDTFVALAAGRYIARSATRDRKTVAPMNKTGSIGLILNRRWTRSLDTTAARPTPTRSPATMDHNRTMTCGSLSHRKQGELYEIDLFGTHRVRKIRTNGSYIALRFFQAST
jgi:hypothetical protein